MLCEQLLIAVPAPFWDLNTVTSLLLNTFQEKKLFYLQQHCVEGSHLFWLLFDKGTSFIYSLSGAKIL